MPPDAYKTLGPSARKMMAAELTEIACSGLIPGQLLDRLTHPIWKEKGSFLQVRTWRPITLVVTASKIIWGMIVRRGLFALERAGLILPTMWGSLPAGSYHEAVFLIGILLMMTRQ